ncbi:MAG: 30S ribosomal protein S12 methylthiotransferase RimO [Lachnospiraceae bacterium]|nr:30S ribosomal protein S12 methylthiotransferase RimO [Lachnospiraceae bacterium]
MKICFISLGCDKNLVDSEVMLGLLRDAGHTITDREEEADAIVINTCCFIHDAKEESVNTIIEMNRYRTEGCLKKLIVTGCLAERYADEIRELIPEVDGVIGTAAIEDLPKALISDTFYVSRRDLSYLPRPKTERVLSADSYVSYLKIAEGCDKHCTYCIIPKIRGPYRSVPEEQLVSEAEYLAKNGTKELILVAQETTVYGVDLYGKKMLPDLLTKLCRIDGIEWIRILYCYPEEITDELIEVMKNEPKICRYLDMPIQHASDAILKRMGRRTSEKDLKDVIRKLRKEVKGITLRTTLITGFPGETEEDFERLMAFAAKMKFNRLGVFTYSKEEDTAAAKMKPQIPKRVKEKRRNALMKQQRDICAEYGAGCVGKKYDVIIDGLLPEEGVYVGRTYMDAPGIDGTVYVETTRTLMSGDIVPVRISGAEKYDLIGECIE